MLVRVIGGHGGVSPGFRTTSFLIDGKLLIDAGSVASGLQIEEQSRIDNILISHSHLDHISDLAFLADNCFGLKQSPFEVYADLTIISSIKNHIFNDVIWPNFTALPSIEKPIMRLRELTPERWVEIGGYNIFPVPVNHQNGSLGFIVEKGKIAILFTLDTGPTFKIWEYAHLQENLKAIFTEVSFPNQFSKVALDSLHHTPKSISEEILKMPNNVPIFLSHLKPNFQHELITEVSSLNNSRINLISSIDQNYFF